MNRIITRIYEAPCGELVLGDIGGRLCLCDWVTARHRCVVDKRLRRELHAEYAEGASPVIDTAMVQLDEYFAGRREEFDIPLLHVGTDFQKKVWKGLGTVPYGETVSYASMALLLGSPNSVRAVASAIGANGISIFVPCHRVTGSDGSLIGYAGGLAAKEYLLELEYRGNMVKFAL